MKHMLNLDDPRWAELNHAYGPASDIPALLRQLESFPASNGKEEPWFSLWSSLAHQGDVYSASFAAVPHVVRTISMNPLMADWDFFKFPAWVEICRQRHSLDVPVDLASDYFEALSSLPSLVAAAAARKWDAAFLSCALAAVAAAKGYGSVAEAALELDPEVAAEFMKWFHER
jgi:hypothetical protein